MTSDPKPRNDSRTESFQPISVKSPAASPLLFRLRCLIDLQLGTIVNYLRPALAQVTGRVLDVGAGQSPWRAWLPAQTSYQGIDVGHANEFGMEGNVPDVVYYDGRIMPFADGAFDCVLCIEVLEHSQDPQLLVSEIRRVIKPAGLLLLTVPWSARQHHLPHDYHRFTRERLRDLFSENGFEHIRIRERGNDISVIANKLTVLTIRLLHPFKLTPSILWRLPLFLLCGLLSTGFIVAAHLSEVLGMGAKEDPLGYFVQANKVRDGR